LGPSYIFVIILSTKSTDTPNVLLQVATSTFND
jgi:hypothetical protein